MVGANGYGGTPGRRGWQETQIRGARNPQEAQALTYRFQQENQQSQSDQYLRAGLFAMFVKWLFR